MRSLPTDTALLSQDIQQSLADHWQNQHQRKFIYTLIEIRAVKQVPLSLSSIRSLTGGDRITARELMASKSVNAGKTW